MRRVLSIAGLFVLGVAGQYVLWVKSPLDVPLGAESAIAVMGGLRSLASEIVWFRAGRMQREGHYVELQQLASTLTRLEPHESEVWSYAAWNLAYNISVMMPTYEDRWRWVHAAMKLLRDEGLRLNPKAAALYRELAWLFELKMGTKIDPASPIYREKWRQIVRDVERRDAWKELGMDRDTMREVEAKYGIDEWTHPMASAIYWADRGLACAGREDAAFLREIIRQSKFIYRQTVNMIK